MTLKGKARTGGALVALVLAGMMIVAAVGIAIIRVGGPLHASEERIADLTADILPPPEYVIEPFLEVTLLERDPASLSERRARLRELEGEWRARLDHWADAGLEADLAAQMAGEVGRSASAFWSAVDRDFLPAVASGDAARRTRAYAQVASLYARHRAGVDRLVAATETARTAIYGRGQFWVVALSAMLGLLGCVLLALIALSVRYLLRTAFDPLAGTAQVMTGMAGGDLDLGRTHQHRDDEIGEMTRAIEVFRATAEEQRAAAGHQRAVVEALREALGDLAQGNVARRIDAPLAPEYEALREAWNASLEPLGHLIGNVAEAAEAVSVGSQEIRAAADDLALRNERQASFVEDTAAALEQLVEIVRDTSGGTVEVGKAIGEAHDEAEQSRAVVTEAIAAMSEIETSAREIGKIIAVIDGISFQTNLLALNAGVEAARAGEAGKGFAVVANEVRALAQRSAEAAADIKQLISASTAHVGRGVQLVGQTGVGLDAIGVRVGQVNTRISAIAQSAELQAMAISKIHESVDELDRMTQQNAAMVEQSSAAARSLSDQSGQLVGMCARFRTGGTRAGGGVAVPFGALPGFAGVRPALAARPDTGASGAGAVGAGPLVVGNLALKPESEDWAEF